MYKTCWYIIITYEFEYKSGNSSHRYRRIPVTDCIMMSLSTRPIACKSDIYSCTDLIQLSSHASWYKTSTKPNAIQALAFDVEYLFLYKTSAEPENPKTNRLPKQLTGVLQQITADIYDCCFTIHIQEILELSAVFTRAHNLLSAKWKSLCFTAMQIIIFRLW